MTQYERGSNAGLVVLWTDFPGGSPVAVTSVQIQINELGGPTVVGPTSVGVTNPDTGYNAYAYAIPGLATLGQYEVIWTGLDPSLVPVTAYDTFEVVLALTPGDIGAVPDTRTINTINGLTGGGDLSADRTFEPVYGTTSNTVAEGDDARIVGAQQRSVIDAKGDLYAGTADNTTTRLPAGTNGQVLRANSAVGTGLEWDTLTAAEVGALPIAGGTMTGPLVLDGDPAGPLEAATKQYVDAQVAASCGSACEVGDHYDQHWWFADGVIAANVRAAVFLEDQNTLASIFSDPALTVPLANPTTTDGTGRFVFYAADGTYWVAVGNVNWMDSVKIAIGTPLPPEDFQPLSTIDAKGDLYVGIGPDATTRLGVGADTFVLTADSGEPSGIKWAAGGGGGISPTIFDAKGDVLTATAADTPAVLPVGTDGQALRANSATSTGLEWDTLTASDVGAQPLDADLTQIAGLTPANDDIIQRKGGVWTNRTVAQYKADQAYTPAEIGAVPTSRTLTAGIALSGGGDLSADRTFDVDLGTTAGTAAAGDDARITGAQQRSTLTTKGDLYVATAAATVTREGVGTDGQVLRANSAQATGIEWHTLTAGDINAVPTSRLITTTNGLQGGGDLSADRTLEPVYGTLVNTVAQGNDTRIVNAVQNTRAVNTTNGLTGGGDLSADRTLQPVYGTAVNTVAQGNDTRIVNAIQGTLFDAKGDLITASANDTPVRQAVGTDNQVLVADSALTNGIKWGSLGALGIAAMPDAVAPRASEFFQAGGVITVRSSKAVSLNVMYLYPIPTLSATTLTGVAWETTSATATAVVRLGLYAASSVNHVGTLIVDFGQFLSDTLGVIAAGMSQARGAGLNWLAFVPQVAAPNMRHGAGWNPYVGSTSFPNGAGTGWNTSYFQTGVSGVLPGTVTIGGSTDAPIVGVKYA